VTEGPEQEGQAIDQRLLGLSPQQAAELARSFYGDGKGPLDGPYVPVGSGTVLTASGRSPQQAESEGPVAPATTAAQPYEAQGHADGVADSRPAQPPSGPTGEPPDTTISMEMLQAAIQRIQQREATMTPIEHYRHPEQEGPPPGYRPPEDPTRAEAPDPVALVTRLLTELPELIRWALPGKTPPEMGRARSVAIQRVDEAWLWFREALERRDEHLQDQDQPPPPRG